MNPVPEIVRLVHSHLPSLEKFFSKIALDEEARYFHPHPFNAEAARRICSCQGKDLYFGLFVGSEIGGYGILRGWDEGFATPSLGLYIGPDSRGTGASKLLMCHLHLAARLQGAGEVMLKVYPENTAAVRLYRSLGYVLTESGFDHGQLKGTLKL